MLVELQIVFTRNARGLGRTALDFIEALPSPLDIARDAYADFRAYTEHVRREQEDFQAFLQDLGIRRLERQTPRETIALFYMR